MHIDAFGPGDRYSTRLLSPADLAALQQLFERAADYFLVMTGAAPAPDEAQRAFVGGPPTKSVNDKRTIGVFEGGSLVGVLDAVTDWPEDGTWSMGMLLIDPAHRGTGLGTSALLAYERWAASEGAREFRTAVVQSHHEGSRFLQRNGYQGAPSQPVADSEGGPPPAITFSKSVPRGEKGLS